MNEVGVHEFYTGKSILLTGATGFLGKAMTEKLLRTCPDIKMLYLLIRTKKGKDSHERINDIVNDLLFDLVKKENPDWRNKVTVISGDVLLPDLGISESDRKIITEEVEIVFHGAATVRFDEQLKDAIDINVDGTKKLLKLCTECQRLKALVHVSTAYANCNKHEIKEIIYPPPITADQAISIAKNLPADQLERFLPMIIHDWPNTYSFTKQIAEDLVKSVSLKNSIPTAIYRPAIVMGANSEPIPGWVDNVYGPTGVFVLTGAGILRTMHADLSLVTELVPVDMTVNAALAIAWDIAKSNSRNNVNVEEPIEKVPVYNFVSSKQNPLTWKDYQEHTEKESWTMPSIKVVWFISLTVFKNQSIFYLFHFLLHILPALLVDLVLWITGKEPKALKIYRKVQKFLIVISYFCLQEWNFHNDNLINLWEKLPEKDKKLFNFDIRVVDWSLFLRNKCVATRSLLFQDTPETIPAARRRFFRLWVLHRLLQIIFVSLTIWIFWPLLSNLTGWMLDGSYFFKIEKISKLQEK